MIITIGANSFSYSIDTLGDEIEILDLDDEEPKEQVDNENPDQQVPENPEEQKKDEDPVDTDNPKEDEEPKDFEEPADQEDPKDSEDQENPEDSDEPDDTDEPGNPDETKDPDDSEEPNESGEPMNPGEPEFLPYKVVFFLDNKEIEDWNYEGEVPAEDPFVWSIKEPDYNDLPEGYILDEDNSTELPFEVTEEDYTIFVYYVMDEFMLMAIGTPGYYTVDLNTIIVPTTLQGESVNTHTIPVILWSQGGTVYAAIKSTHQLQYMKLSNLTSTNFDEYNPLVKIYVDGIEYAPTGGLQGNTKDAHWTVFMFDSSKLNIPEDGQLTFFIKGIGGGHDVGGPLIVHVPKIDVTGYKEWVGGGNMPPVTLQLMRKVANGILTEYKTGVVDGIVDANENPAWSYTWKGVPEYSPYGQPYIFSIDEETVPPDYEKTLDGLTVINTFVPKGEITITKIVENYSGDQVFDIFIYGSNGKTYTLTLKNRESGKIEGLEYGEYEIKEIIPMNFELVSISTKVITISPSNIVDSAIVTNRRNNDGWFYDDDELVNNITVGVTTTRSRPIEERHPIDLEQDIVLPKEDFVDDEIILEEDFD